jgi:hypothetical protein
LEQGFLQSRKTGVNLSQEEVPTVRDPHKKQPNVRELKADEFSAADRIWVE